MKPVVSRLILFACCLTLAGCATSRDLLYFQDIDEATLGELTRHYELVIKRDDELKIIVSGPEGQISVK